MLQAISTELVETGEKRDARGRKISDEARRAEVLAAYDCCRLTQRAFARQEGIKYYTLAYWLKVRRKEQATPNKPVRFAELRLGGRAPGLEVSLPGGIAIRGDDAGQIAALVKALSR
ncbi:MAG: hypothetical protein ABSA05_11615 [Opitutaceae bacterium]|jgi:hypothetical protein